MGIGHENRASLYAEVTGRVIAELEQGRLPWVQPWDAAACGCAMPANAVTGRRYSGINVLILWAAVIEGRYYSPSADYVAVPPQLAFYDRINWYRTVLHELGHWTGHSLRLGRDQSGMFGSAAYAREELVAEMASAFTCASLEIRPTVRHADYVGSWLAVLREDEKAIFRAASAASKAADYLLGFTSDEEAGQ